MCWIKTCSGNTVINKQNTTWIPNNALSEGLIACLGRFGGTKTTAWPLHGFITVDHWLMCDFFLQRQFPYKLAVKTWGFFCLNWDVRWKSILSLWRTYLNWWIWAMCILWLCEYLCCAEMVPKLFFFPVLQFPGEFSEEQVVCAYVCVWASVLNSAA